MSQFVNVRTESGEKRIAGISRNGEWFSVSSEIASLEGGARSSSPDGDQCNGEWLTGQTLIDEATGQVYPQQNPECRCARQGIHRESFCGLCS